MQLWLQRAAEKELARAPATLWLLGRQLGQELEWAEWVLAPWEPVQAVKPSQQAAGNFILQPDIYNRDALVTGVSNHCGDESIQEKLGHFGMHCSGHTDMAHFHNAACSFGKSGLPGRAVRGAHR